MFPFYACRKSWLLNLNTDMRLSKICKASHLLNMLWVTSSMRGSRNGVRGGPTLATVLVEEVRDDPNIT